MNRKQKLFILPVLIVFFPIVVIVGVVTVLLSLFVYFFENITNEDYYTFKKAFKEMAPFTNERIE